MRLVSQAIDRTLTATPNTPMNFSLLFNKFLQYRDNKGKLEPVVKQDRKPLISEYLKSKKEATDILKQRQLQQANYCQAMEAAGWRSFIIHARLTSPFVSGLGIAHPTETGLVLDHTSGMPYIPATSQKGVLRVAHLINSLCDEQGKWLPLEVLKEKKIINDKMEWQEDDGSKTLFGSGGDKNALAGQVVVLDAYPLTPPELGEEILNPHFGDYYKGNRGPTEDQSPIPIKFLVMKQGADFVFRLLLRTPFTGDKDQTSLINLLEKTLRRAITEEGMGAKTSLGFGRFEILAGEEPGNIQKWLSEKQEEEEKRKYPWRPLVRKIAAVTDWGQLKQTMEQPGSLDFQNRPEVAQALYETAMAVRKHTTKKWPPERDQRISEWLSPAGLKWQPVADSSTPAPDVTTCSPEEQATIEQLQKLADWGSWKTSGIDMATLSMPALKTLRSRFKKDWDCDAKRAKEDKRAAWKELGMLIKKGSS